MYILNIPKGMVYLQNALKLFSDNYTWKRNEMPLNLIL